MGMSTQISQISVDKSLYTIISTIALILFQAILTNQVTVFGGTAYVRSCARKSEELALLTTGAFTATSAYTIVSLSTQLRIA